MTKAPVLVSTFYFFGPVPKIALQSHQQSLQQWGEQHGIKGLVLLAEEGINATIAGDDVTIREFVVEAARVLGHPPYRTKESRAPSLPFRRFQVQVREELVTFKGQSFLPSAQDERTHLSPQQWNEWLRSNKALTILDTRNWYESKLGTFRKAILPPIQNFTELPRYLAESEIPRDRPLLMFCTGGIRCEKTLPELRRLGFSEVYQLDGGILNYLSNNDNREFEGECFVFDHRVAVDNHLQPSAKYRLCPHCGNPGSARINCARCAEPAVICESCQSTPARIACSKNCAHHLALKSSQHGAKSHARA